MNAVDLAAARVERVRKIMPRVYGIAMREEEFERMLYKLKP